MDGCYVPAFNSLWFENRDPIELLKSVVPCNLLAELFGHDGEIEAFKFREHPSDFMGVSFPFRGEQANARYHQI